MACSHGQCASVLCSCRSANKASGRVRACCGVHGACLLQARHDDVEELYAFSLERKMASVLVREADGLVLYNKARLRSGPGGCIFPFSESISCSQMD